MAQVPWAGIFTDLRAALEQEIEAAMRLARRATSVEARRDPASIRLAIEVGRKPAAAEPAAGGLVKRLRAERETAVLDLAQALKERSDLAERIAAADAARKSGEAALRRIRARLRQLEAETRATPAPDDELAALRDALDALRTELERERIARAAAEASLSFSERERESLRDNLHDAGRARDEAQSGLREALRGAAELQSELAAVWRVLRQTGPSEMLREDLDISGDARKEGVDRVQAKIIDARELFKRRSHRWPAAS